MGSWQVVSIDVPSRILEEVLDQHFGQLKKTILEHMLTDSRDAPKRMHDAVVSELNLLPGTAVQTASKARVKSRAVRVGDVVLMYDNTIAEVCFSLASVTCTSRVCRHGQQHA